MGSPRGKFNAVDFRQVLISFLMAMLAASVTWLISDGLDTMKEWIPTAVFPLVYAVLVAVQRWLSDNTPKQG